ncbi:MAG: cytochrome c [Pseudomonadota bacterium]|nr:cytochrome c [Pseudomonadota bacterium]MDP1903480.1 cytochrome c [Pseudomonadota bacterium]MDP2351563.1 cytochrome c [Pseudomonadota bacterium]
MLKRLTCASLLLVPLSACGQQAASEAETPAAAAPATQPAVADSRPPAKVARQFDLGQMARGKDVYERHCQSCHGAEGKGQAGDWRARGADGKYPPPPLDDSAHAWHHPTAVLHRVIKHGGPGGMPAWKDSLSDAGIDDVIVYIKSLWSDDIYAVWHDIERRSLEP